MLERECVFYHDDDHVLRCDRKPLTVLAPMHAADGGAHRAEEGAARLARPREVPDG